MFKKINYFMEYFKYFKNPISCLFFKFGLKKSINIQFKYKSNELEISNTYTIDKIIEYIKYNEISSETLKFFKDCDSNENIITLLNNINIYNPRLYDPLNHIFVEYYDNYYSDFNINWENRIIIDIGANSGDSALYFASQGAEVYGFEPVKEYYEMGLKNIDLNPKLKDKITFFNKGVSYKNGRINIDSMKSAAWYVQDDSYDVEIISIEEIITHVKPDILKMDCEGCEFEIIEKCNLSMFNEIIFEHHSFITGKDYKLLANKLQNEGFNLEYSTVFNRDIEEIGFIYAFK